MSEQRARKWMWAFLAFLVAVQAYFVRELLAALLLFALGFAVVALLASLGLLVREAGRRSVAWFEARLPAMAAARRSSAWSEVSKRPFRRPHSEPAQ